MKTKLSNLLLVVVTGLLAFSMPSVRAAKVRVGHVDVFSLATGIEDTHGVPMKPSFIPRLNRADLLLLVGFGCEHAFLPALLEASKNPRIHYGKAGYVDCGQAITPRDVPQTTDHSAGDVHPYGNPHYMLDPVLAEKA